MNLVLDSSALITLARIGLLLHGKANGSVQSVGPILNEMIAAGFFIDDSLYRSVLHLAEEEPAPESGAV